MSSIFPKRPDSGGTLGRTVDVKVNIFQVRMAAEATVFQYDIKFDKEKLPNEKKMSAFCQAEQILKQTSPDGFIVFDGNAIAFSTTKFEDQTITLYARSPEDMVMPPAAAFSGGRGGRGGGRGGGSVRVEVPSKKLETAKILSKDDSGV